MESHDVVKDYYGKQLQSSNDLKTDACCDASAVPDWLKPLLSNIHDEVLSRYYGCGLVCPTNLRGARVLDLGSGSGRDVYALAQLVGPEGEVVGVDMTPEQLEVARRHQAYHVDKFGYDNVRFVEGYIERLDELGLEPNSFDVVVSNCVINLSPDKDAVIAGAYNLLKEGGEIYFSDVYADRRVPAAVAQDPVLLGECLGGALYWNDFLAIAKRQGFFDPRLVEKRTLEVTDSELKAKVGSINFMSATYRLFKLPKLEPECEDYGQAVIYKGTIPEMPQYFVLDEHHVIEAGRVFPVCGNTWMMLADSRFASDFEFIGNFSNHFGIFPGCGGSAPFDSLMIVGGDEGSSCC
ncbi:methyltransferase domain-containing protein [Sessilibacter sp. MAH1]